MAYMIKFSAHAARAFRKLERPVQARLYEAIEPLRENPRPHGSEKLKGSDLAYRIRVGDYRILYEIIESALVVYIIEVGHRREVCRR